jgi:pyruvate dehydrogenase E1 component alpha subunit/2-oxoisovalerate dehydrogenase E1 component alpha subunit
MTSTARTVTDALDLLAAKGRWASPALRRAHLRWMFLGRALDDRLVALYRASLVQGNVFTGHGQEALSAAIGMHLRQPVPGTPGDVFAPLIRDTAGRLAFGESALDAVRTYLAKRTGPMRGRDGNIHRGNVAKGQLAMISHLGAMVSTVCGVLMARRLRGEPADRRTVGVTCLGDGSMATGAAHEGLNVMAIEKLPMVVVVANNQVSYSTFNERSFACRDLVERAAAYGMRGVSIDGTDAEACLATVGDAIDRARRGEGPQMVVATLLRLQGHGTHDDASYVPKELRDRYGDCIELAPQRMVADGVLAEADVARLWEDVKAEVQQAVDQARSEPEPDPDEEDWCAFSVRDLAGQGDGEPGDGGQR